MVWEVNKVNSVFSYGGYGILGRRYLRVLRPASSANISLSASKIFMGLLWA
jgi:hypothetical protein